MKLMIDIPEILFEKIQNRKADKRTLETVIMRGIPQEPKTGRWTIKQYQVPIENKQIPTITATVLSREPTACKSVYTYTHSVCKSEEYLNKFNFCPNCGAKMESEGK